MANLRVERDRVEREEKQVSAHPSAQIKGRALQGGAWVAQLGFLDRNFMLQQLC